jgi:hypothetical protein
MRGPWDQIVAMRVYPLLHPLLPPQQEIPNDFN